MPLITLGNTNSLVVKIPSKGDTNWSEDIKAECFQKIVDHDHSSSQGVRIPTAGIAGDAVDQSLIADNAVQIEHKKTYSLTLDGTAQDLSGLAMTADQAFKINYKVKNSAGTSVQVGNAMGQAGDFITDEFVGTDMSATLSYNTNQLQITGTSTDVLEYSIEFLE